MQDYESLAALAETNSRSINRTCIDLLRNALIAGAPSRISETKAPYNVFSDPLIATYRGGNGELFPNWYPFLEGFSTRFVSAVLDTYAPRAKRVLDPFGGTGTTPLTVAKSGGTGLYCELNGALQFVTQVKVLSSKLNDRQRQRVVESLRELALAIPFRSANCTPDVNLERTYYDAFRNSRYFDDETFQQVLRLRTLADDIEDASPTLGQLFMVAVLASLVPCSLMKRAGDLRYRTERELNLRRESISRVIANSIEAIACDIEHASPVQGSVILLADDARALNALPNLEVECVVTSPPYLNGTNYFRNTKLELWFLRLLRKSDDLSYWRSRAITAGINDVNKAKADGNLPAVADMVRGLAEKAYDKRIPTMVSAYFNEIQQVLSGLTRHLVPGAVVAIDIGDSRYAGIRVPTDELISEIASELGYRQSAQHTLRQRKSRDTGLLRQSLLVFEYGGHCASKTSAKSKLGTKSRIKWDAFKTSLPHRCPPYKKRNWGNPLHSLCSYQGKMKPSLANFLVETFSSKGGRVLDPFAGVGTIPFEAALKGRVAYAFEISPAALAITRAKLTRPNVSKVDDVLIRLHEFISSRTVTSSEITQAGTINFNRGLNEFYHPNTFSEILLARRFFSELDEQTPENSFVLASLLHILHGNRPYALSRRSHPITPFAPSGQFEYRSLMKLLRSKVTRGLGVRYPDEFRQGFTFNQDATSWWPREVENLDAIITSPPFFDSTRFYLANWIRLWFCGWEKQHFTSMPLRFLDVKQKESMRVYESIFRHSRDRLSNDGVLVLHLGKSSKCDMAQELSEIARPWLNVVDVFEENVTDTESHGITDKGNVTGHQFLVLK